MTSGLLMRPCPPTKKNDEHALDGLHRAYQVNCLDGTDGLVETKLPELPPTMHAIHRQLSIKTTVQLSVLCQGLLPHPCGFTITKIDIILISYSHFGT